MLIDKKAPWYDKIEIAMIIVIFSILTVILFVNVVTRFCFHYTATVVGAGRALPRRLDDLRRRQPRGQDELAPPGDGREHGLRRGAAAKTVFLIGDVIVRPLRMPSHVQNLRRHDARHVDGPGLPGDDVAALVDALPLGRARHGRLHAQGHPAPLQIDRRCKAQGGVNYDSVTHRHTSGASLPHRSIFAGLAISTLAVFMAYFPGR